MPSEAGVVVGTASGPGECQGVDLGRTLCFPANSSPPHVQSSHLVVAVGRSLSCDFGWGLDGATEG